MSSDKETSPMTKEQFYYHEICITPEILMNMQACDKRNYADKRRSIALKHRILTKIREAADTMLTKKQKEAFYLKLMGKNSIQIGKQLRIAQMSAWERLDRAYRRIQQALEVDPEMRRLLRQINQQ